MNKELILSVFVAMCYIQLNSRDVMCSSKQAITGLYLGALVIIKTLSLTTYFFYNDKNATSIIAMNPEYNVNHITSCGPSLYW